MKYRQTVITNLENAKQISESIQKGLDNHSLSPGELYNLNKRLLAIVSVALDRVNLEYDEAR